MSEDVAWRFDELHPDAYRMLVEGVPAILYIDRPDELSTNLYTSPQIESLLGYSVEEWMADPELWRASIHPEDRDRVSLANEESNRNAERYVDEYRIITKDGRTVWIRDEAAPVRGLDGTLLYWRGVMLDITERKEAEEKLRWSLDVLRRVMTLAETSGVQVVPHSAYFGPGLLASIHCIAAMPTESLVERFYCDFDENPLGEAIHPQHGRIAVPQGPGLGMDPDARLMEKLRTG
jgi:PAS domain S-box-containing protein